MTPADRQILDDIIHEAYEIHGPRLRDVAVQVVAELRDLEGSGVAWVAQLLDDWLVSGASTEVKQWMRRQPAIVGQTKSGTPTEVPAFGGVRIQTEDGHYEHVQLRLLEMTADELDLHIRPKLKQRNTLSRSLSFYETVLADMREHGHAFVADAVECIGIDSAEAQTA